MVSVWRIGEMGELKAGRKALFSLWYKQRKTSFGLDLVLYFERWIDIIGENK